jgi:hypothetical protein
MKSFWVRLEFIHNLKTLKCFGLFQIFALKYFEHFDFQPFSIGAIDKILVISECA